MRKVIIIVAIVVLVGVCILGVFLSVKAGGTTGFTHLVRRGPLRITLDLEGRFEASQTAKIVYRPELYDGELTVTRIVEAGSDVQKGQLLIQLDTSKIKSQIDQKKIKLKAAQSELKKAQEELKIQRLTNQSNIAKAEMEKVTAYEALRKYKQIEGPKKLRDAELALKEAKINLEREQDELDQLRKMYRADEITEETEKIVLKRAKQAVQKAKENVRTKELELKMFREYEHPAQLKKLEMDFQQKQAELERTKVTAEANIAQKESDVLKAEVEVHELQDQLAKLQRDLERMTMRAPQAGKVFYGTPRTTEHDFLVIGGRRNELRIGGKVYPHTTLLSIPNLKDLIVRTDVFEADINKLRPGLKVTIRPDAFPNVRLTGEISEVGFFATRKSWYAEENTFDVKIKITDKSEVQLKPGMKCNLEVLIQELPSVLKVPVSAIFEKGGRTYCYLSRNGKWTKREVKLGKSSDRYVQIKGGIKENDRVLLYDPEER